MVTYCNIKIQREREREREREVGGASKEVFRDMLPFNYECPSHT